MRPWGTWGIGATGLQRGTGPAASVGPAARRPCGPVRRTGFASGWRAAAADWTRTPGTRYARTEADVDAGAVAEYGEAGWVPDLGPVPDAATKRERDVGSIPGGVGGAGGRCPRPTAGVRPGRLPAMHALLADPRLLPWVERVGRARVRNTCATVLDEIRAESPSAGLLPDGVDVPASVIAHLTVECRPRLHRVINATGVVLHTGLGRAPLAPAAAEAVRATATRYSNLEFDLDTGERGDRSSLVAEHLRAITGAEAALVVNNNAAAVLLLLSALAAGRQVVVSRGELVEIGGSFRVPEVLTQSGAHLREVGTTNRTYAGDYAAAVGADTALLLKVHQSNFRIVGFATAPSLRELVEVGRRHNVPVAYDMGSGALAPDLPGVGSPEQIDVRSALATGLDVVTFSGDKLLGGPQAGLICGSADHVRACARHPLHRAVRVDKMTLAALEATLNLYRAGRAAEAVPALTMLARLPPDLLAAAQRMAHSLSDRLGTACKAGIEAGESAVGAGALPDCPLPTSVVALRPAVCGAQALAAALRRGDPPVVARIRMDAVLLDPRTLFPEDEQALPELVAAALERTR